MKLRKKKKASSSRDAQQFIPDRSAPGHRSAASTGRWPSKMGTPFSRFPLAALPSRTLVRSRWTHPGATKWSYGVFLHAFEASHAVDALRAYKWSLRERCIQRNPDNKYPTVFFFRLLRRGSVVPLKRLLRFMRGPTPQRVCLMRVEINLMITVICKHSAKRDEGRQRNKRMVCTAS